MTLREFCYKLVVTGLVLVALVTLAYLFMELARDVADRGIVRDAAQRHVEAGVLLETHAEFNGHEAVEADLLQYLSASDRILRDAKDGSDLAGH